MSKDNELNNVTRDGMAPMPERNVFEEFGEENSSRNIVGMMLKFSKGDWDAGDETFPVGKKMIVNMDELLLGWIRWEDQKPADQRMGRLVDGFKKPARWTLGFGYVDAMDGGEPDQEPNTSEWEVDDRGQARDPWQESYYLIMKDPDVQDESEGIYTFPTSSVGGSNAIIDLCKIYGRKIREGYKDHYPIVALKVGSYQHPNKNFGKIKVPVLPIVGWVSKSIFGALPPPTDATLQIADARKEEEIPF